MQSGAKTSSWAVLLGASLGAALAVVGPGPSKPPGPEHAPLPFTPAASIAQGAAPSTQSEATLDAHPPIIELKDSAVAPVARTPSDADASALSLDCARGDPVACLARADLADRTADVEAAQLHRRLAVQKLVEHCAQRNGGACARLGELYRRGAGVQQNTATADALSTRAALLCQQRPSAGCPAPAQSRVP